MTAETLKPVNVEIPGEDMSTHQSQSQSDSESHGGSAAGDDPFVHDLPDDVCSEHAFAVWYSGRFRLVNLALGMALGGPFQSLKVEPDDPEFREASNALYRECLQNRHTSSVARWLLKPPSGKWNTLELQGAFLLPRVLATGAEVNERIRIIKEQQARAAGAAQEQETQAPGTAAKGESDPIPGREAR